MTAASAFVAFFDAFPMWQSQDHFYQSMSHMNGQLLHTALDARPDHFLNFAHIITIATQFGQLAHFATTLALFVAAVHFGHIQGEAFLFASRTSDRSFSAFDFKTAITTFWWGINTVREFQFAQQIGFFRFATKIEIAVFLEIFL